MVNLLKMVRYQLLRDWVSWAACGVSAALGFFLADGYLDDVLGESDQEAQTLADVFGGMVYDSTFLLILLSALVALRVGQQFSARTVNLLVSAGHGRSAIYTALVLGNLAVSNLAALLYPCLGTLREVGRFGLAGGAATFTIMGKIVLYSLLLNSAVFLLAMAIGFVLRASLRAMAAAAMVLFVLALYMAYGMGLGWPVAALPLAQIRYAVASAGAWQPATMGVGVIWALVSAGLGWWWFKHGDLK